MDRLVYRVMHYLNGCRDTALPGGCAARWHRAGCGKEFCLAVEYRQVERAAVLCYCAVLCRRVMFCSLGLH